MKEYTIKEVAEALEKSKSTIRRKIKSGEIKATKKKTRYGETYFIPANEIKHPNMVQDVVEFENKLSKNELIQAIREVAGTGGNLPVEMKDTLEKLKEEQQEIKEQQKQLNEKYDKLLQEIQRLIIEMSD